MSVSYAAEGGTSLLRMDDGSANTMHDAWCEAMHRALDAAEADSNRALVVIGRPGFFSAGLDLKVLPKLAPEALVRATENFMATMQRVFLFPKPIVAASTGHAIAGGMMLYLAADLRVALDRPEARYGLNEATNGIPLLGGTAGICQYGIPPEHHTELILHGRMIGARESAERGISHELVEDPERLLPVAHERAEALADVEPAAYRVNKRLLREPAWDAAVRRAEALAGELPGSEAFARLSR